MAVVPCFQKPCTDTLPLSAPNTWTLGSSFSSTTLSLPSSTAGAVSSTTPASSSTLPSSCSVPSLPDAALPKLIKGP
eukprot:14660829-Ditylum_brightwellii.AAC.1